MNRKSYDRITERIVAPLSQGIIVGATRRHGEVQFGSLLFSPTRPRPAAPGTPHRTHARSPTPGMFSKRERLSEFTLPACCRT
jgi:hypothetical protein